MKKKLNSSSEDLILNSGISEPTECQKEASEMRYLIRRQNRYGQWVHIDTTSTGPALLDTWKSYLRRRFGPGKYHIAVAQEGVAGLRSLEGHESVITVDWRHRLKDIWTSKPSWEDLVNKYGAGDYLVARLTQVEPYFLKRNGVDENAVGDLMDQGASAYAGSYIVIKLLGVPYE